MANENVGQVGTSVQAMFFIHYSYMQHLFVVGIDSVGWTDYSGRSALNLSKVLHDLLQFMIISVFNARDALNHSLILISLAVE